MGVYIKGLKIPQSGSRIFALTSSGMVEDVCGLVVGEAVEVKTPHGDLIDVRKTKITYGKNESGYVIPIFETETIIEAEEKGDNENG